ncbi:GMC family oxidoreductase [Moorena producens JHB]|uniref:GMC family oxidoreductase n=1 Tax=Moorena producens (strain JHB) TaxID=1454205 RepID=A0A1D9G162_MOOP1|nr:GMC family oxidoreductase [Moorena producens]AOY81255.1 GMC family oxidoreductase [Moorena producens JHB]
MYLDARTLENHTQTTVDLCIIGAGAAGITIARELINSSVKVLLLESGGFDGDTQTQALYEGENIGLPYFPLDSCRLRYFGGTTNHWGGMCAPLDAIDFQPRPWVPYSGWPIRYHDLVPYYNRAHQLCQLPSPDYEMGFWEFHDPELERLPIDESKLTYKIFQLSPPTRFGQVYRSEILQANNIILWTHANVTAIETVPQGKTVTGLRVRCFNQREHYVQARFYVLACGGIENARLLLLSNQTIPQGLGNHYDLVGRFFMEHLHIASAQAWVRANLPWKRYTSYELNAPKVHLIPSEGTQENEQILNFTLDLVESDYFGADYFEQLQAQGGLRPEMQLYLDALTASLYPTKMDSYQTLLSNETPSSMGQLIVFSRIEQAPNPESRVSLSEDKDELGLPKVQLNWQLTDLDRHSIEVANTFFGQELGRLELGRLQYFDWLNQTDSGWPPFPDVMRGGWHHMGTTRMSDRPETGVVDSDCQVFGIDNLYIAGSSVYPTAGTANPTLTLVALALRLADRLKGKLTSSFASEIADEC